MTGGPITGPNGPQPPGDPYDPFQSLHSLTDQFEAAISASMDDPEQFLSRLLDEILSMPPEDRFENAVKVMEAELTEESGSPEAFTATLPFGQAWLDRFLDELLERAISEVSQAAFKNREENDWLILLPVLSRFRSVFSVVGNRDLSQEEIRKLFSAILAVFVRLYGEIGKQQESKDGSLKLVAEDLIRADRVISSILTEEDSANLLDDVPLEDAYEAVLEQGAVICYAYVEISVGRGGELLGITEAEFKELLISYNLEPRHGPESLDDLNSGPDLDDG